jgi:hypothetical protein
LSIYSPLVTWGFDPELSKIVTQGLGSDAVIVQVTVLPGSGGRSSKRRKDEEDRLIRIRVISEDGKIMVQERLIPFNELNKITIKVNESGSFISGSDIYISIKEKPMKEGETHQIKIKAYETSKR